MKQTSFREAEDQLEWWYARRESEMGLHAQSYESTGGGGTSDPHLVFWTPARRRADALDRAIAPRVGSLSVEHRQIADAAFAPRGWPEILHRAFARRCYTLVGLAIVTPAARLAREAHFEEASKRAKKKGEKAPRLESVVEFLVWRATQNDRALRSRVCAQAESALEPVLEAFTLLLRRGAA